MRKTCEFVDIVFKIGGQLSELNPIIGVTFDLCNQALEALRRQGECGVIVTELVIGMGDVIPLIDAVKDQVKVMKLKTTIVDMLHLIEDASRFVIEYKSDEAVVREVRGFISLTAREQVDQFVKQFKSVKENFDRGMMAQITLGVEALLNDADREMLTKLITPDAGYDPSTGCLEGTRIAIRNDIHNWIDNSNSSQSLFWLYGLARCGKSTIARSVCKQLGETNRLAGAFFCKRDKVHLSKPENVVSTLAANLASVLPPYGARLVTALRQKPQLATSALAIRFRGMVVEPITGIGHQAEKQTVVIVVDALNECGTTDTRTQLLACMVEPSRDTNEQLGLLYTTILNEALGGLIDDAHTIRCCIAAVILTRIPLVDTALAGLLAGRVGIGELWLVIRRLASVLYRDQKGVVRVLHQSFGDYMVGERCPVDYRMDQDDENLALATSCLQIMIRELRFNICGLQDSRRYNHEIPGLTTRIQEQISPHLNYSCVYWASHLSVTPVFDAASQAHQAVAKLLCELLLGPRALYWIEVLSLLERLHTSESGLLELIDWIQEPTHEISIHASELQRFVAAFYPPISQSTPHLYVSAMTFGSKQFDTIRTLKGNFPNVVEVARGNHLGKISNRWLRVIPHSSPVEAVAYSAEGKLLATSSGEIVQVWESRTCTTVLNPLEGHSDSVTSVAFSPDSQYIVSGSRDKTVRVWDLRIGAAALSPLQGHSNVVTSVAVSPDGRRVVSGSWDKTVRVWDLSTGVPTLEPLRGHTIHVQSVACSPNGQHIVSGSWDKTVRVWDLYTGDNVFNLLEGHAGDIYSVAFSPDGKYVATGDPTRRCAYGIWVLMPDDFTCSPFPPQDVKSHQLADSFTLTHDGWVLGNSQRPP